MRDMNESLVIIDKNAYHVYFFRFLFFFRDLLRDINIIFCFFYLMI